MAFTFCTSDAAAYKAGANASTTVLQSVAIMDSFSDGAEGRIEQETNTDWTTNYANLSTSIKNALSDCASSMVAMSMIAYDTTGFLSREADMLMNWNDEIVGKSLSKLKGKADKLKTP